MPSEKVLEQKKLQVSDLSDRLKGSVAGVVVDYKGINVADDTQLRNDLRTAGIQYTVVKNTLLHRAAAEAGLSELDAVLEGTTALATSIDDHTASARILAKFAETHANFTLKSGFLDGAVIDSATLTRLALLPSREVLLASVCNVFNAPIAAFARAIQAIVDKDDTQASTATATEATVEA